MDLTEKYVRWLFDNLGSNDGISGVKGYDCVEVVRKTRDMHYKMESGLPYKEEEEYLENMRRYCDQENDKQIAAFFERKKELALA